MLEDKVQDSEWIQNYIEGRDFIDLLNDFPRRIRTEDLYQILRKLPPREYSISSSYQSLR